VLHYTRAYVYNVITLVSKVYCVSNARTRTRTRARVLRVIVHLHVVRLENSKNRGVITSESGFGVFYSMDSHRGTLFEIRANQLISRAFPCVSAHVITHVLYDYRTQVPAQPEISLWVQNYITENVNINNHVDNKCIFYLCYRVNNKT